MLTQEQAEGMAFTDIITQTKSKTWFKKLKLWDIAEAEGYYHYEEYMDLFDGSNRAALYNAINTWCIEG